MVHQKNADNESHFLGIHDRVPSVCHLAASKTQDTQDARKAVRRHDWIESTIMCTSNRASWQNDLITDRLLSLSIVQSQPRLAKSKSKRAFHFVITREQWLITLHYTIHTALCSKFVKSKQLCFLMRAHLVVVISQPWTPALSNASCVADTWRTPRASSRPHYHHSDGTEIIYVTFIPSSSHANYPNKQCFSGEQNARPFSRQKLKRHRPLHD